MSDLPDLKENLGPLPVWAWGGIVGVVVVAWLWFSQNAGSSGDSVSVSDSTDSVNSDGETPARTGSVWDAIDGSFDPSASGGTLATADIPDTVDSNTAWGMRAVQSLIGTGENPLTAQAAVYAYLEGDPLTDAQTVLVNQAVRSIGQPPSPVAISTTAVAAAYTYRRDSTGQIYRRAVNGAETTMSDSEYLNAGLPALTSDLYQWRYTTLGKAVPLSDITNKFKVTPERLMALNKWKSIPQLKKGLKVKVPA